MTQKERSCCGLIDRRRKKYCAIGMRMKEMKEMQVHLNMKSFDLGYCDQVLDLLRGKKYDQRKPKALFLRIDKYHHYFWGISNE